MRDILADLYYGNLNPSAKCYDCNGELYSMTKHISTLENQMLDQLKGKELECFQSYHQTQTELTAQLNREFYMDGFRTGAQLALAMVQERKSDLKKMCE